MSITFMVMAAQIDGTLCLEETETNISLKFKHLFCDEIEFAIVVIIRE